MEDILETYGKKFKSLTLCCSLGCNLKCDYCLLNKSLNENSSQLQKENIQALKDGSYLSNILNIYKKLYINPAQIKTIDIWGQEPTLILQYLTENIQDWLEAFPEWNSFMFSTNGMDYTDRIIECVKKIDNIVNREFLFDLQFSYDGDYDTEVTRGANSDIILNNIINFILAFNNYTFKKVKIKIAYHGVISNEMIKRLNTQEKVLDYYNKIGIWIDKIYQINKNPKVEVPYSMSFNLEGPADTASTEDGIRLAAFFRNTLTIPKDSFINEAAYMTPHYTLSSIFSPGEETLNEYITKITTNFKYWDSSLNFFKEFGFCGSNILNLKIMYDGTIIFCQNNIFETKKQFLKSSDENYNLKNQFINNYFINPLIDENYKQKILKVYDIFQEAKISFRMVLDFIMTEMYWLSKAGQIDMKYSLEKKELLKHALLIAIHNNCPYNNYIVSKTMYAKPLGYLRLVCNGFMDLIETEYNNTQILGRKKNDLE